VFLFVSVRLESARSVSVPRYLSYVVRGNTSDLLLLGGLLDAVLPIIPICTALFILEDLGFSRCFRARLHF
jgi:hypothetical protein